MVAEKEIITDLKKYNKELEKYLPELEVDFLTSSSSFSNTSAEVDDNFALLANNILDLRTEMALIRKNLSNDIEGMVSKMIVKQQNDFMQQTTSFYNKIILDMKNNFAGYIKGINSEISDMKKEFNVLSIQNLNFEKKLSSFNGEILDFKSLINDFNLEIIDLKDLNIGQKLDSFGNNVKNFSKVFEGKFGSFQENLITLNKTFATFDSSLKLLDNKIKNDTKYLEDTENLMKSLKVDQDRNNFKFENEIQKVIETMGALETDAGVIRNSNKTIKSKPIKNSKTINSIKVKNQDSKILSASNEPIIETSTVDKLINIDERLNKLNSLR